MTDREPETIEDHPDFEKASRQMRDMAADMKPGERAAMNSFLGVLGANVTPDKLDVSSTKFRKVRANLDEREARILARFEKK